MRIINKRYLNDTKKDMYIQTIPKDSKPGLGSFGEKEFFFAIVMAIYNVEDYLEEAIESLINQTINFQYFVQLILVNDGSTDGSAEIARKYADQYPANIVFINKKNGGVSSARNKGLAYATGRYINFMDPDDKLKEDALQRIMNFIKKNPGINLIAFPLIFFEAKSGNHMLNYKFDKERIVYIDSNYKDIIMSMGATVIKKEKLHNKSFLEGKKFGEDNQLLTEILMEDKAYGIVPKAKYFYRKRYNNTSALQNSYEDIDYYIAFLEDQMEHLVNRYKSKDEALPKYIQFLIMYDLQWRLRLSYRPQVLQNEEVYNKYLYMVFQLLQLIDNKIILEQKYLNWYQKHALITFKYSGKLPSFNNQYYLTKQKKNDLSLIDYNGKEIYLLSGISSNIDIFEYNSKNKRIEIVGNVGTLFPYETLEIYLRNDANEKIVAERFSYPNDDAAILGNIVHEFYGFRFSIDEQFLENASQLKMYIKCKGKARRLNIKFTGQSVKFSNKFSGLYVTTENSYISYSNKKRIFYVKKKKVLSYLKNEYIIYKELKKDLPSQQVKAIIKKRFQLKWKKRKEKQSVNLFLDRIDKADDNAEVLYAYFKSKNNAKNYFILTADSKDRDRLKKNKYNIVDYKSDKHFDLLYTADNLISSHADRFIYNPFPDVNEYYRDLKTFNYSFLQHGIIKDDMSSWLKRTDKNFSLFVTSAEDEYNSIVDGNYQYNEESVILSGLPRYDNLELHDQRNSKKIILIAPTWRKGIVNGFDTKLNGIPHSDTFKNSDFFIRWNGLLSNPELLQYASDKGYQLIFLPHPAIRQQLSDFSLPPEVRVAKFNDRYTDLINAADLLITDFSSIFFDMAYRMKPVIYYHFDAGNWDNINGYFDYKMDGFGSVIEKEDALVTKLKKIVENNCELEGIYRKRIINFFGYHDNQNSQRVYEAIIKRTNK